MVEEILAKTIITCLTEQGLTYKKCSEQLNVPESIIRAAVKQEGYEYVFDTNTQKGNYIKKKILEINSDLNLEKRLRIVEEKIQNFENASSRNFIENEQEMYMSKLKIIFNNRKNEASMLKQETKTIVRSVRLPSYINDDLNFAIKEGDFGSETVQLIISSILLEGLAKLKQAK